MGVDKPMLLSFCALQKVWRLGSQNNDGRFPIKLFEMIKACRAINHYILSYLHVSVLRVAIKTSVLALLIESCY